jgi:hypothetical protein
MNIREHVVEPQLYEGASSVTSRKPWATDFKSVKDYDLYKLSLDAYNSVFGELFSDDIFRLERAGVDPPETKEYLINEGDVDRYLSKQVSGIVMPAFDDPYLVLELSQSDPIDSNFSGRVDRQFIKKTGEKVQALAIGELKAPGTIDFTWADPDEPLSTHAKNLGKELRG